MPDDSEVYAKWQNFGDAPPSGGIGPICAECGHPRWIELGGGEAVDVYIPNLDTRKVRGVTIVTDLENDPLPFHDGHAERIKSIQMLNHLSKEGGERLLRECYRVLAPRGSLYIMVTDFAFLLERLREDGFRDCWMEGVYGAKGGSPEWFHKWGFSFESLKGILLGIGFARVEDRGYMNRWELKLEGFK